MQREGSIEGGTGLMPPRRVLIVTYDFPPAIVVGGQACAQVARYLPAYGWEPVVLTVRERHITHVDTADRGAFPGAVIRTRVLPHPLDLYRWLKSATAPKHPAEAAPPVPAQHGGLRRWVSSLLVIPDECNAWILPALSSGLAAIRTHRVRCIFSSGPRWTNHVVGLGLAKLTGLPWVAQFRDPWVDVSDVRPMSAISVWMAHALRENTVRAAQSVACVTEEHMRMLRGQFPKIPPAKFITIPNGYDGAEWEAVLAQSEGAAPAPSDQFVITYAGSLYLLRSPLPLFRALRSLIDKGEIAAERIRVDLIGTCEVAEGGRVAEMAARFGLSGCVNITGVLNRGETLDRVARSNLLLLLAEAAIPQIPGKTYEYLRAGRPILAVTTSPAVTGLLRSTGGAWIVEPTDERGIAAALLEAYRCWRNGARGPQPDPRVVAGFDRRLLAGRFAALFEASIASVPPARLRRWPSRAARPLATRANPRSTGRAEVKAR